MQQWLFNKAAAQPAAPLQAGRAVQAQSSAEADDQQANSYSELLAGLPLRDGSAAPLTVLPEQLNTEQSVSAETAVPAEAAVNIVMPQASLAAELNMVSVLQRFTLQNESVAISAAVASGDELASGSMPIEELTGASTANETAAGVDPTTPAAAEAILPAPELPVLLPAAEITPSRSGGVAAPQSAVKLALTQPAQVLSAQPQVIDGLAAAAQTLTPAPLQQQTVPSALPLADSVLPQYVAELAIKPVPIQAVTISTELSAATSSVGANISAAPETVFQWKAEYLGTQSSQWGQKLMHLLSDKINLQLGQQIQRAQIRLDPPQLGLIELTVSLDAERTSVQLYASNSQMREAMQQNLDQLRQQLTHRLGQEQALQLDVRDKPAQQQQSQHQQSTIAAQLTDDAINQTAVPAAVGPLNTDRLNRLV